MTAHTIDDAIQLLEQAPHQRLVGPRTQTWYHGDRAQPDRVCPILYLAEHWLPDDRRVKLMALDQADDVLALMGLDRSARWELTDAYDHARSKEAGIQRVVKRLRELASSPAATTVRW